MCLPDEEIMLDEPALREFARLDHSDGSEKLDLPMDKIY
jgi:hypothetical protein